MKCLFKLKKGKKRGRKQVSENERARERERKEKFLGHITHKAGRQNTRSKRQSTQWGLDFLTYIFFKKS